MLAKYYVTTRATELSRAASFDDCAATGAALKPVALQRRPRG